MRTKYLVNKMLNKRVFNNNQFTKYKLIVEGWYVKSTKRWKLYPIYYHNKSQETIFKTLLAVFFQNK